MAAADDHEWMTLPEAARRCRVGTDTIRSWVAHGLLTWAPSATGGLRLIHRPSLEAQLCYPGSIPGDRRPPPAYTPASER